MVLIEESYVLTNLEPQLVLSNFLYHQSMSVWTKVPGCSKMRRRCNDTIMVTFGCSFDVDWFWTGVGVIKCKDCASNQYTLESNTGLLLGIIITWISWYVYRDFNSWWTICGDVLTRHRLQRQNFCYWMKFATDEDKITFYCRYLISRS